MTTAPLPRPSFHDAYLVSGTDMDRASIGVVRRDVHVWRIFRFGILPTGQSTEVFETREAAGQRLIELAHAAGRAAQPKDDFADPAVDSVPTSIDSRKETPWQLKPATSWPR